jgi:protocatechuate 3,4-dioxygenase beta subunit
MTAHRFSVVVAGSLALIAGVAAAQVLPTVPPTPAQTEGPYYPVARPADTDADLTRVGNGPPARGEVLTLSGVVRDCTGNPVAGARFEIWQTDHQGIYLHPGDQRTDQRDHNFQFYGELRTDAQGAYRFRTILPGPYTGRPRHIHAKITPPGGATLTTQFYLKGDTDLAGDFIVRRLGRALPRVLIDVQPQAGTAERQATLEVVTGRGC